MSNTINKDSLLKYFRHTVFGNTKGEGFTTAQETDTLLREAKELFLKSLAAERKSKTPMGVLVKEMSSHVSAITPSNIIARTLIPDRKTLTLSSLLPVIVGLDRKLITTIDSILPEEIVVDELNQQQVQAYNLVDNILKVVSYENELAMRLIQYMNKSKLGQSTDRIEGILSKLLTEYKDLVTRFERYVEDAKTHSRELLLVSPTKITDDNRVMFLNSLSLFPKLFSVGATTTSGAFLLWGVLTGVTLALVAGRVTSSFIENARVAQGRRQQAAIKSLRLLRVDLEEKSQGANGSRYRKELSLVDGKIEQLGNSLKRMGVTDENI